MSFQISGLTRERFSQLLSLDDSALSDLGARRCVADKKPGFPCRISLKDAEPGETLILTSFQHQPADSPYRASGPIFVREAANNADLAPGMVPELLRARLLSVKAYDTTDSIKESDIVDGPDLETLIARFFGDREVRYLHVHSARPGCYLCRIDRA